MIFDFVLGAVFLALAIMGASNGWLIESSICLLVGSLLWFVAFVKFGESRFIMARTPVLTKNEMRELEQVLKRMGHEVAIVGITKRQEYINNGWLLNCKDVSDSEFLFTR